MHNLNVYDCLIPEKSGYREIHNMCAFFWFMLWRKNGTFDERFIPFTANTSLTNTLNSGSSGNNFEHAMSFSIILFTLSYFLPLLRTKLSVDTVDAVGNIPKQRERENENDVSLEY